jgi:hypothetical protein
MNLSHECRICFEDSLPLIKPCNCEGTMSLIHPHCLTQWRVSFLQTKIEESIERRSSQNDQEKWSFPLFHIPHQIQMDFSQIQQISLVPVVNSIISTEQRSDHRIVRKVTQTIKEFVDMERNDYFQCPTCCKYYCIEYQYTPEPYGILTSLYETTYPGRLYSVTMTVLSITLNLFITWYLSHIINSYNIDYKPFSYINHITDSCSNKFNFQIFYTIEIMIKCFLFIFYAIKIKKNIHQQKRYLKHMSPYILLYLWCTMYYVVIYTKSDCDDIHSLIWIQLPFYDIFIFYFYTIHEKTVQYINCSHKFRYRDIEHPSEYSYSSI